MISPQRGALGLRARSFNALVKTLVGRLGVPVPHTYILRVHGRSSGTLHTTPVLVLKERGSRYLVAPRGETQWTRNLHAAGWGELMRGRRVERVRAVEVIGPERKRAIRAYERRYRLLIGRFFDLPHGGTDEEWRRAARRHPVFRLASGGPGRT